MHSRGSISIAVAAAATVALASTRGFGSQTEIAPVPVHEAQAIRRQESQAKAVRARKPARRSLTKHDELRLHLAAVKRSRKSDRLRTTWTGARG